MDTTFPENSLQTPTPETLNQHTLPAVSSAESIKPPALPLQPDFPASALLSEKKRTSNWFSIFLVLLILIPVIIGFFAYLGHSPSKRESLDTLPARNYSLTQTPGTTLEKIVQSGKIIIGSDTTNAPLEFLDENGIPMGYDIDIAEKISENLGVKPTIVSLSPDEMFTQLSQKKVDVIISSITISPLQTGQYDFSTAYLNSGDIILTAKTNTSISSFKDLSDKKVGVQKNSAAEQILQSSSSSSAITSYTDNQQAITDLVGGKIDAIVINLTVAKNVIMKNPSLQTVGEPFTHEAYGVVFRKGDEELVHTVNDILSGLERNGYLTQLRHKWL